MNKTRQDGLYLLLMGAVVFLLFGIAMENASATSMLDFKAVFYGARCLIGHSDPYKESEILRAYQADGGQFPADPIQSRVVHEAVTICVNLPSTLFLLAPFALLPLGGAQLLWMALTAGSIVMAAVLVWDLGADSAPLLSGALAGLLLANSEMLLMVGNTAGIVVALCVGAVWCFVRGRLVPLGILLLAVSLAIKPHDAGLAWLYFLLAGGANRKRALQAVSIAAVLALPALLWVWQVSPHWMQELHANLSVTSAHGGLNDPAMAASGAHAVGMPINLQSALSAFRDDPRFYHPASYLICIVPLLVLAYGALRFRTSQARTYLALAAIAALTLLPAYHRPYDARLLFLAVPACALLWAEGGAIGRAALWLSVAGFLLTGDPWAILLGMVGNSPMANTAGMGRLLTAIQVFPAPAILLAMGSFYLWVYARRGRATEPQPERPTLQ
jgi:hypothetical protein